MPETAKNGLQRLIFDTARQLLTTTGYAQLSMRNIAETIGYSATSIYLYFENKDELVHALIDEGVDLLHERLVEANDSCAAPQDRLLAMCKAYVTFGFERPEYYEIMYVLHPEYIKRYPAEKYRKARRNLELIGAAIEEGRDDGPSADIDSFLAANLVWTQLHGVVTLLASERVDKRIDPDQLIEGAYQHILRSLGIRDEVVEEKS